MKIEKKRPAFTVFVYDAQAVRGEHLSTALTEVGYSCRRFDDEHEPLKSLLEDPPHILVVIHQPDWIGQKTWLRNFSEESPETHIILVALPEYLEVSSIQYSSLVYEVLAADWSREENTEQQLASSFPALLSCIDRAATLDYYLYMNEQLKERLAEPKAIEASNLSVFNIWARQLKHKTSSRSLLEFTCKEIGRYLKGAPVIYFKYMDAYKTLVPYCAVDCDVKDFSGVGVDLRKEEVGSVEDLLSAPANILGLSELVLEITGAQTLSVYRLQCMGATSGVMVALDRDVSESDIYIKTCLEITGLAANSLEKEKKLHEVNYRDEGSGAYNLHHFNESLEAEVSRSRRLHLPTTVSMIEIDDFIEIEDQIGSQDADYLMRMIRSIISENIRVNDFVGRIGRSTFAIVFAHTPAEGGAVKVERLRGMIEGANFSKILPQWVRVTVSSGVSEYPRHGHDTDDLYRRADEALQKVKESGKNLVCLAAPPLGFVPDFSVEASTEC